MRIRQTKAGDSDAGAALLRASYPVLMKPSYDSAVLARALEPMTRANPDLLISGRYFAALDNIGSIIACGGWSLEQPGSGKIKPGLGHIRHFAVLPDWIGQGLGRAIYDGCETQARDTGINKFECYSSLNAKEFYSALGFTAIGTVELTMGDGITIPSLHMSRET